MSEKIYALLLLLYPARFRRMYGEDALQLVHDRIRDERGPWEKVRLWWDLLADFAISAPHAYVYVPAELAGTAAGQRAGGALSFWTLEDEPMRAGTWVWAGVLSLLLVGTSAALMDHAGGHPLGSLAAAGRDAARQVHWTPRENGAGMPQGNSDVEVIGSGVARSGKSGSASDVMQMVVAGAGTGSSWAQTPVVTGSPTAGTGEAGVWEANAAKMEFDVASVKESKSSDIQNSNFPLGPGTAYVQNGGNFIATNTPLINYILFAYKMGPGTAQAMEQQLPGWVTTERFDITAKTNKHDATKDEIRLMMRSLLAERFKLVVRSETAQVPVYGLVLAKPGTLGPKLRAHVASEPCEPLGEKVKRTDTVAGGFPKICGGIVELPNGTPGMTTMGARDVPIKQLVGVLAGFGNLGRPVLDQTGLTGTYDFLMEYAPERRLAPMDAANDSADSAGPGLEQALRQQLGLKLESKKGRVEVWVVDHVEHATPN